MDCRHGSLRQETHRQRRRNQKRHHPPGDGVPIAGWENRRGMDSIVAEMSFTSSRGTGDEGVVDSIHIRDDQKHSASECG